MGGLGEGGEEGQQRMLSGCREPGSWDPGHKDRREGNWARRHRVTVPMISRFWQEVSHTLHFILHGCPFLLSSHCGHHRL